MSDKTKRALITSAIVVTLLLGATLAILYTGGFSHFAEVTKNAFTAHTEVWVVAVASAGALIVGGAIGGVCVYRASKEKIATQEFNLYNAINEDGGFEITQKAPTLDKKKRVLILSAIAVTLLLGGMLAILYTGGFSHFAEVTKNAFTAHTEAWVAAVASAGALIVGGAVVGGCLHIAVIRRINLLKTYEQRANSMFSN